MQNSDIILAVTFNCNIFKLWCKRDFFLELDTMHIWKGNDLKLLVFCQENPEAVLEDLEKPGVDEEPSTVLLRYFIYS